MLITRTGRLTTLLVLISLGLVLVVAQESATTYEEQLASAKDLLRLNRYDEAVKGFRRANEMRDKKSAECYVLMSDAYLSLEAYKNVIAAADKSIALAGGDTQLLLTAYNNKGLALLAQADKKDQTKLEAAEVVFREALKLKNAPAVLRYNLGVVLLQLNRDEEGVAEIEQYMKLQPKGSYVGIAKKLVENPRRARENFAPDFSFTSSDGEYITLEDLKGKVVMLDFWGTWCPPCVASVPELRNLYRRYSKEQFVLIGISSDHDDAVWRDFTNKNRMNWLQYLDRDRHILEAFSIRAYPTYIIIDHEGILRFQSTGFGSANLDAAVKRQIRAARSVEAR
ncbi:MAG TPA: redoxin domain-containing protein [Pyrinomonadaceae bacterium]|nr:redoxin domain-containing protein [Pyrinomonadaceae bacterium]